MNTGTILRKLFASYASGDHEEFLRIAEEIIEDEERKNNKSLAKELRKLVYNGGASKSYVNRYKKSLKIPHDRERGLPLLEIKEFKWDWSDIILDDNNRNTLEKIILENKKKQILKSHDLRAAQKILLFGPPGCGKTLAAEVLSSILMYPMIYIRFDGVVSSYLGETSSNLRKIFDFIDTGEWVVFFDEFDIIGKKRDSPFEHGEMKRVVNNLLQMIDNYTGDSIIVAATNHQHLLDSALWRRFDEIVYLGIPDKEGILAVFRKCLRSVKTSKIDYEALTKGVKGMSPSDIEAICFSVMKKRSLSGRKTVSGKELELAIGDYKKRLNMLKQIAKEGN